MKAVYSTWITETEAVQALASYALPPGVPGLEVVPTTPVRVVRKHVVQLDDGTTELKPYSGLNMGRYEKYK